MGYCVAVNCKNKSKIGCKLSFHSFPLKNKELLKKWIVAMKREKWTPTKWSQLCSSHFAPEAFQLRPNANIPLLKDDAVPSIFNFPEHLVKPIKSRRILNRNTEDNDTAIEPENMDIQHDQVPAPTHADVGTQVKLREPPSPSKAALRRKVKNLKAQLKRREIKCATLQDAIDQLRQNETPELVNFLEENANFPLHLLTDAHANSSRGPTGNRYSQLTKRFALTVHYYSPRAYAFLREQFGLPHPRELTRWIRSVDAEPGYLDSVFQFLKNSMIDRPYLKDVALVFDSMSIRAQILYEKGEDKVAGYVDLGGIIPADKEAPATEALVFLVVSMTDKFKCPIAYFLCDKLNSSILSTLTSTAIEMLHDCGVQVHSITCDGTNANVSSIKLLGGDISKGDFMFLHPQAGEVFIFMDPCHMLKLARNALAECKLESPKGPILWSIIKKLNQVQDDAGLKLANKLSGRHVNFKNKIMNVSMAAQTLSSGVADALEFFQSIHYNGFDVCEALIEFIRIIDWVFDFLNCRSPFGKGYKQPIRPQNIHWLESKSTDAINYLYSLTCDTIPLSQHPRKMFVLGFIVSLKSAIGLAKRFFARECPLKYFLTYKISQDHIELFFSCIRGQGGWNNNPNSLQFKAAIKKLLLHNAVKASKAGNCIDDKYSEPAGSILEFRSSKRAIKENVDFPDIEPFIVDSHDIRKQVIYYIAGYIVRSLRQGISCHECLCLLLQPSVALDHTYADQSMPQGDHSYATKAYLDNPAAFTEIVSRGGLLMVNHWVFLVCQYTDSVARSIFITCPKTRDLSANIVVKVVKHFTVTEPLNLVHSTTDFKIETAHEVQLIKEIAKKFSRLILFVLANQKTLSLHRNKATVRQKLTKLILFNNC